MVFFEVNIGEIVVEDQGWAVRKPLNLIKFLFTATLGSIGVPPTAHRMRRDPREPVPRADGPSLRRRLEARGRRGGLGLLPAQAPPNGSVSCQFLPAASSLIANSCYSP